MKTDDTLNNTSQYISQNLRDQIAQLLDLSPTDVDINQPLLEIGADSLILVEVINRIDKQYGVRLAIRQMFEDFLTIDAISNYIHQNTNIIAPCSQSDLQKIASNNESVINNINIATQSIASPPLAENDKERLIKIEALLKQVHSMLGTTAPELSQSPSINLSNTDLHFNTQQSSNNDKSKEFFSSPNKIKPTNTASSSHWLIDDPNHRSLNTQQQNYLSEFIKKYTNKTQTSKKIAANTRSVLCDSRRSFSAFQSSLKELSYSICANRSNESRFWDVDGNEYIDIAMGFGVHLFGHNPPFLINDLNEQLSHGLQLGPVSELAGEVATSISNLTHTERVTFCNTGTEAVMTALRIARAATGRRKVVLFKNAYHGHFDGTLVIPIIGDSQFRASPMSIGSLPSMADDLLILNYGEPRALEIIAAHRDQLAAVLVEPVQNRRPDLHPGEFLKQLRHITKSAGIILIFDEILVGFRIHPGGAQAWFGIQADLVTYAKVLGGGLPIGVIAGNKALMDRVDGGMWFYGDNSRPIVETTYTAGTYARNPLSLTAAHAILNHIKTQGPSLQEHLNKLTSEFADSLNKIFQDRGIPLSIAHFGSFFRFAQSGNLSFVYQPLELDIFIYHLIARGIYIWEGGTCFLSTAHTINDLNYIKAAVIESLDDMQNAGFWSDYIQKKNNLVSSSNNTKSILCQSSNQIDQKICLNESTKNIETDNNDIAAFSIAYFGNYSEKTQNNKYDLLFQSAQFADENGFSALWIPERHFHLFGGFSPNPSIIASALAMKTKNIALRAGSVVLPLHHPVRVAEEWSMIDNFSQGRVGMACASGWHPNDFILSPNAYESRREIMFNQIETIRKLWRGESVNFNNGKTESVSVKIYPRALQKELPIWIATLGSPETYAKAGEIGANILTNLIGQNYEQLEQGIKSYKESLIKHGHNPQNTKISLLLHTYILDDLVQARENARQPMYDYLDSSINLFQRKSTNAKNKNDIKDLSSADKDYILSNAFERYVKNNSLIGTPESCEPIIEKLVNIGVNEFACFIDFGIDANLVVQALPNIKKLAKSINDKLKLATNKHTPNTLFETKILKSSQPINSTNSEKEKLNSNKIPSTEDQYLLWLISQINPEGSLAYHLRTTLRLTGDLNQNALKMAVQKLILRHDALRTTFSEDGKFQLIHPNISVNLSITDLSRLRENQLMNEIDNWFKYESSIPFDLKQGPLLRINVIKTEHNQYLLVFSIHHIICDGISKGILLKELGELYTGELANVQTLQTKPLQFSSYIAQRNERLNSENILHHENFWKEKFKDSIPVLELPVDRPYPSIKSYRGNRLKQHLGINSLNAIRKFSTAQNCTPFMTMLSIWILFLHKISMQKDLLVGVPAGVRSSTEGFSEMIGYSFNLLPIRSQFTQQTTTKEFIKNIKQNLLQAFEHHEYPFARLIDLFNARDWSKTPLVNTSFNWDKLPIPKFYGLTVTYNPKPNNYARFDISLNVNETEDDLILYWEYNTDLFNDSTIDNYQRCFLNLLDNLFKSDSSLPIYQLSLMAEDERKKILNIWSGVKEIKQSKDTVLKLFDKSVRQIPLQYALKDEKNIYSYESLNEKANILSHTLRDMGVKANVIVGLCTQRSAEMIIGILAILKAGGAFVSLDINIPEERRHLIVSTTNLNIIVVQSTLINECQFNVKHLLTLEETINNSKDDSKKSNGNWQIDASHLAYIVFTSGSTGIPKGVAIEHRQLCSYVNAIKSRIGFVKNSSYLLASPIFVDLGYTVLFSSLCHGGCLHVISQETAENSNNFLQYCKDNVIDYLKITPTHLEAILSVSNDTKLEIKSAIILGGEIVKWDFVQKIKYHTNDIMLYNHYGPTEATIGATTYQVNEVKINTNSNLPIGKPLSSAKIYILDNDLQVVPLAMTGEIYIGGPSVAKEYYKQPELTADKFIQNPYSDHLTDRLYKTGDCGKFLSDGNIEYLKRNDDQIKIRGFRVEPKEIESLILKFPHIQQAIVTLHYDKLTGNEDLVAYIISNKSHNDIATPLREFLKPKIPSYMIPTAIILVDNYPRLPNGKLDKKSLPNPSKISLSNEVINSNAIVASNDLEEKMIAIWQEILGVEKIRIHDDFFDLGGHSIHAIKLCAKVKNAFGLDITIKTLFEESSVAALTNFISKSKSEIPQKANILQVNSIEIVTI